MIPVMLMRIVVLGKRYSWREYMQVFVITLGISLFMFAEEGGKKAGKATSWIGLALCFLSLFLDGWTSPTQERIYSEYKPTLFQMMLQLNFWAMLIVAAGLMATGQFTTGLEFVATHSFVIPEIALFSLLSAVGQAVILYTLKRFNSLVLVTITTTRKLFTIFVSVLVHGHAINATQWMAVVMVFSGLGVEVYDKYQQKMKNARKAS
jgi:UDP-galactose transporter B1